MLQSSRCSSRFQLQPLKKKRGDGAGKGGGETAGEGKKANKKKFLQLCTLCSRAVALKAVMKRQAVELLEVISDPFASHTRACAPIKWRTVSHTHTHGHAHGHAHTHIHEADHPRLLWPVQPLVALMKACKSICGAEAAWSQGRVTLQTFDS